MKRSLWKLLPALPLIAGCGGHWTRTATGPTPPPSGSCGALPSVAEAGTVFYNSEYGAADRLDRVVYAVRPDGSCRSQIGGQYSFLFNAQLSPDGTKLLLDANGAGAIFFSVIDMTGTRLSGGGNIPSDGVESFSPDSKRVLYTTLSGNIETVDAATGGDKKILLANSFTVNVGKPVYSPDGSKVAFKQSSFTPGDASNGIYVMNADGTGKTKVVSENVGAVRFTKTGLLYETTNSAPGDFNSDPFQYQLVASSADGTGAKTVATQAGEYAVSPDGTWCVFETNRDGGDLELYRIDIDGANLKRLTTSVGGDAQPSVSGDGTKIAFVSERDGNKEIYVMNADGTAQTRLTQNFSEDERPVIR